MVLCSFLRLRRTKPHQVRFFHLLLVAVLMVLAVVVMFSSRIQTPHKTLKNLQLSHLPPSTPNLTAEKPKENLKTTTHNQHPSPVTAAPPPPPASDLPPTTPNLTAEKPKENLKTTTHNQHPSPVTAAPLPSPVSNLPQTTPNLSAEKPKENLKTTTHNHHPSPATAPAEGPYHNWELFAADYQEMMQSLKIFVYPDVNSNNSQFAHIFLPHPNPFDPKLGNYFSEHAFKLALLQSSLITPNPEEAHFFFMPFSINAMRNDPLLRAETTIADFVAQYTANISSQFKFWNASSGSDHFYICCHSVGRDASSKHQELHNNAIQVTCCSSYFQRLYITHKDFGLPQVWPRRHEVVLNPPDSRDKLAFFSGRVQNSRVRQELMDLWGNDSSMDIFSKNPSYPYEEGFRRSRFCLHVIGYEVNTARVSDAIHFGCVPVIISNYYDLPFANVLDWSKFSIIIGHGDVVSLKKILMSVSKERYLKMYQNLGVVRRHFAWHMTPKSYDSFYLTAYQLWLRRGLHRLSY